MSTPKKKDAAIFVRCTQEQKDALTSFVEKLSKRRVAKGQTKLELSTWMRELALRESGNKHLGAAAEHRAAAASLESLK